MAFTGSIKSTLPILKVGHNVTVYNRTRAKAQALATEGELVATSIAGDVARWLYVESYVFPPLSSGGALLAAQGSDGCRGKVSLFISEPQISRVRSGNQTNGYGRAPPNFARRWTAIRGVQGAD
jgi:hypothetical protein